MQQLKKDTRYQRVVAIKVDVEGDFKGHFQEFDDVAEASMKIYMNDNFKGVVVAQEPPQDEDGNVQEKSEVQKKAEMMLQVPLDELQEELE